MLHLTRLRSRALLLGLAVATTLAFSGIAAGSASAAWPDTTITSGPASPTNVDRPMFKFKSNSWFARFQCKLDGGSWGGCRSPYTTATLDDGPHSFSVRAVVLIFFDWNPATANFVVDTVPPTVTIQSPAAGATLGSSTVSATFSVNDATASATCSLDGAAPSACTSPHTFSGVNEGAHTLVVAAKDPAGNAASASSSFTVQHPVPPDTTLLSGPSGLTNDPTPSFTFSSNQNATFECSVDTSAFSACTSPFTMSALVDGQHTFVVRARGATGVVDPTPAAATFVVDATPPSVAITEPPDGAVLPTRDLALRFTVNDPTALVSCALDGAALVPCGSPTNYSDLADGAHSVIVSAIDPAGNAATAARFFSVSIPAPALDTAVDGGPSSFTTDTNPRFKFSSNDPGAQFECRMDSGAWLSCVSPLSAPQRLTNGAHTFSVRAVLGGTVDPTPATREFTVDTVTPGVVGLSCTAATDSVTCSWTPEPDATTMCNIQAGGAIIQRGYCSSIVTFSGVAPGSYIFGLVSVDLAGNQGTTQANVTVPGSGSPPVETVITQRPATITNRSSATFAFSSNISGATFACSVNGGGFSPCSSPVTVAAAGRDNAFQVRATAPGGTADLTPATVVWHYITSPPDTVISSGPSGTTDDSTPTFGFAASTAQMPNLPGCFPGVTGCFFALYSLNATFECSVDAAPFTACANPMTTTVSADGPHSLSVRAVDEAGNVDPSPAMRSFTVAAPSVTISGLPAHTNDSAPTIAFSKSGAVSYECSLDGAAYSSCVSPLTTAALSETSHSFCVRSTDSGGIVDATPSCASFEVDVTPPDTIVGGSTTATIPRSVINLRSNEDGATFRCSIDGGSYNPCAGAFSVATQNNIYPLPPLANGPHTIAVQATDRAGNVDPVPNLFSFTVALMGPEVIDFDCSTDAGGASCSFGSSDPAATFRCYEAGMPAVPCGSPYIVALPTGPHVLYVYALDSGGNSGFAAIKAVSVP